MDIFGGTRSARRCRRVLLSRRGAILGKGERGGPATRGRQPRGGGSAPLNNVEACPLTRVVAHARAPPRRTRTLRLQMRYRFFFCPRWLDSAARTHARGGRPSARRRTRRERVEIKGTRHPARLRHTPLAFGLRSPSATGLCALFIPFFRLIQPLFGTARYSVITRPGD